MVTIVNTNSNCQKKIESSIKQIEKFKSEQEQLFKLELTDKERMDLELQLMDLPEPSVLKFMFEKAMDTDSKIKDFKNSKLNNIINNFFSF